MAAAILSEQATIREFHRARHDGNIPRSSPTFADQDRRHGRPRLLPSREQLAELVRAGVDVFRLNMAHAEPDAQQAARRQHPRAERRARRADRDPGRPGRAEDSAGRDCRTTDLLRIGTRNSVFVAGSEPQAPNELTSTYAPLVEGIAVGDRVMLADGTVSMAVERKEAGRVRLRRGPAGHDPQPAGHQPAGREAQRAGDQRARSSARDLGRAGGRRLRRASASSARRTRCGAEGHRAVGRLDGPRRRQDRETRSARAARRNRRRRPTP